MSGEFLDTNILVYAHDSSAEDKQKIARQLVERLWNAGSGRLSTQVLLEFFWTVTRKVAQPLAPHRAVEILEDLAGWQVYAPGPTDVIRGVRISFRYKLTLWDSMIVLAAIESGAEILWSEDLSPGARFETVVVRNPFV